MEPIALVEKTCHDFANAEADIRGERSDRAMCWHEVFARNVRSVIYDDDIDYTHNFVAMDSTAAIPRPRIRIIV